MAFDLFEEFEKMCKEEEKARAEKEQKKPGENPPAKAEYSPEPEDKPAEDKPPAENKPAEGAPPAESEAN